jgi:putative transposase
MKKRFSEEQIVAILREAAAGRKAIGEVCRKHAISEPTFYVWQRRFGQMPERNGSGGQGSICRTLMV